VNQGQRGRVVKSAMSTRLNELKSGQRVKKYNYTTGQSVLYFGELYEIRSGASTIHLFAGNRRVASVFSDGRTQFYHTNHLGSASVITDQNGGRKEKIEYFPFGTYREAIDYDPNFPDVFYTFTGQEDDDDLAFYNFKARLYDPLLGRFISPDILVQNIEDPQTLNRYSYAMDNPLIYIDPTGHFSFDSASEFDLLYGIWDAFALNSLSFNLGASGTSSYLNSNFGNVSLDVSIPNFGFYGVTDIGFSSNINFNFPNANFSNTYNRGTLEIESFNFNPVAGSSTISAAFQPHWIVNAVNKSVAVKLDIGALVFDLGGTAFPPLLLGGAAFSVANTIYTTGQWLEGNAEWYDFVASLVTTGIGFYPHPVTILGSDVAILIYDIYKEPRAINVP
jgi:RHS repeat-associated protein